VLILKLKAIDQALDLVAFREELARGFAAVRRSGGRRRRLRASAESVKYTLDTNIFIDGFRNEEAQAEVFAFLDRELPFIYLSAVVMQELAAGARTARARRYTQTGIFERVSAAPTPRSFPPPPRSRKVVALLQHFGNVKGGRCWTTNRPCSMTR